MLSTRRYFLYGALAAPVFAQKKKAAPERPNIILILADGLGDWMLGCYGNKEIRTPNVDRLAATGMRFLNCLCCAPVSAAARATLFTGRVPRQTGVGEGAPPASFVNEAMISDVLAGAGYRCGYIGEWHLGGDERAQHGFQTWEIIASGAEPVTAKAGGFLEQQSSGKPFFLT